MCDSGKQLRHRAEVATSLQARALFERAPEQDECKQHDRLLEECGGGKTERRNGETGDACAEGRGCAKADEAVHIRTSRDEALVAVTEHCASRSHERGAGERGTDPR